MTGTLTLDSRDFRSTTGRRDAVATNCRLITGQSRDSMMAMVLNMTRITIIVTYSAFGMGAASRPGPQGQPPGSYGHGYGGQGPALANANQVAANTQSANGYNTLSGSASGTRLGNSGFGQIADVTKQGGGLANP